MIPNILPHTAGSVLLYGKPGSCQSIVGFELAMNLAMTGRVVVYLVTGHSGEAEITSRTVAWRAARNVQIGKRLRGVAIDESDLIGQPAKSYIDRIGERAPVAPALVVRDLSLDMQPFTLGDAMALHWLNVAGSIASGLRCPLVTVCHNGPMGSSLVVAPADYVWKCEADFSTVIIRREKPGAAPITLRRRNVGAAVVLEEPELEIEPKEHAS